MDLYLKKQLYVFKLNQQRLKGARTPEDIVRANAVRSNALWNIANYFNLFGDELDLSGVLTDEQWNKTLEYLEKNGHIQQTGANYDI